MSDNPKVILAIEFGTDFGRGLLRGIAKYIHFNRSWVIYGMPAFYLNPEWRIYGTNIRHLKQLDANGIITRDRAKIEEIAALGMAMIVADDMEPIPGMPQIITDYRKVGEMGADYLLSCGFQHFAFCGLDHVYWSQKRKESFCNKIREVGYQVHIYKQPRKKINRRWENERLEIAGWLKSLPKPIGLLTCTDYRAQQVLEVCKSIDIQVPEEIAVLGTDNDELFCTLSDPPLSSISFSTEKAGYVAAELLDKLMHGEEMMSQTITILPIRIVTRQSTSILAVNDPNLIRAVRFIREHSKEQIQVSDVAEGIGVSRRSLERIFKKTLNHSIYTEIQKTRFNLIATMLTETDISISKIALLLGYASPENLSQAFRREKGMSPSAYRKRFMIK